MNSRLLPAVAALLGHEGVLEAGGEASASSASEAGLLDLVDDPVLAHEQHVLGLVPVSLPGHITNLTRCRAPLMNGSPSL
jgi:hypothetical protein